MHWLSRLFHRSKQDAQLDSELRFHVEQQTADNIAAGMNADEARRHALAQFGGLEYIKEETRDARGTHFIDTLLQDTRFGLRMLRKSPGFTTVAILTLALGVGANTTIFSVVNGVILKPLPFPNPNQLVTLNEALPQMKEWPISYPNFLDWKRDNNCFSSMSAVLPYDFAVTGKDEAERVRGAMVSADFFPLLGVHVVAGRGFVESDDHLRSARVALITSRFWKQRLGSKRNALGSVVTLDGADYTIVGIIPANFDLSLPYFGTPDVYVPVGTFRWPFFRDRGTASVNAIARLKPGVTLEQAKAEMESVTRRLSTVYPQTDKNTGATLRSLKASVVGNTQTTLLILLGAVGCVLLIACVNIANLLLARSGTRSREFAMRSALGAGKGRLIRQLLTESVTLALVGGGLGLLVALWGTRAALGFLPQALPRGNDVRFDSSVLLFTLGVSCFAGIIFGLVPALKAGRADLQGALKEGGRSTDARLRRAQDTLVIAEIGIAFVLLVSAGLMLRTLAHLWSVNPGFNPRRVLVFDVSLPPSLRTASPSAVRERFQQLSDRLKDIPGVQAASLSWGALPMYSNNWDPFWFEGRAKPPTENQMPRAVWSEVQPGYLKAMGIPLERGRFFTPADDQKSPLVTVIDDNFARKYFPGENPLGKYIVEPYLGPAKIVGVVGHVKQWPIGQRDQVNEKFYFPLMQVPDNLIQTRFNGVDVVVRSAGQPLALADVIRRAIEQTNSEELMFGPRTMEQLVSNSFARQRFLAVLLGAFAILALVLASVGVYGITSYLVTQRTHEIGIRMALGAQRTDVLGLVLGLGVKLSFAGVAAGVLVAFGLTQFLSGQLFSVTATDPLTFAGVAILLTIIALLACYIPARRAMCVDPMVALHYE